MSRLGIKIGACLVMMAGVLACLSSCIKDDFIGKGMARDYSSVTISVLLPEPVVTTPTTRAGAADFDQMNDLNVLVAEGRVLRLTSSLNLTRWRMGKRLAACRYITPMQ